MTTYLYEYDMLIIFPALTKTIGVKLVQTLVRIVSLHTCGIFCYQMEIYILTKNILTVKVVTLNYLRMVACWTMVEGYTVSQV